MKQPGPGLTSSPGFGFFDVFCVAVNCRPTGNDLGNSGHSESVLKHFLIFSWTGHSGHLCILIYVDSVMGHGISLV